MAAAAQTSTPTSIASGVRSQLAEREEVRWLPLLGFSCELTVDLPLPSFHLSHFLKLIPGSVISTNWRTTRDLPLRVNGTLIGWGEFDRAGKKLTLRLTELA